MDNGNYYENNYDYVNQNVNRSYRFNSINLKSKLLVGGIILVIVIILIIIVNSIISYYDSYEYFEKTMVEKAREYVKNNNLVINDETYIIIDKLNIEPKKTCSQLSGVFVTKDYKYTAYLSCEKYETDILKNNNRKASLKGQEVVLLAKGIPYIEYGINGQKKFTINGTVGTEEGTYNLNYMVSDNDSIISTLKRKVVVIDNLYIKSLFPRFTLNGEQIEYVQRGDNYLDKGVVAEDPVDLNITNKVVRDGKVNTMVTGEYEIIYTVTNSRGYTNSIIRRVVVIDNFSTTAIVTTLSTKNLTNEDVTINLNVIGDNYSHMILPDGTKTSSRIITYKVSKNGMYSFYSYDKDGKTISKIVSIDNIDKITPNATCVAQIHPNYVNIYVTPYSGKKISGYKYIVNNLATEYLNTREYKTNVSNVNTVSVQIRDSVNNTTLVNCDIKYIDPTIGNNNVKYYNAFGSEYVIPNTRNDLDSFVKAVRNKISQNADRENCGDDCLSFSLYHGYYLQYGNMNNMNVDDACHYNYPIRYDVIYNKDKQTILRMIYDEIFKGRVVVLQIDTLGNNGEYNRHFGLVVGYRRSVHSRDELKESDLIYIDAWNGNLRSLDPKIDNGRHMFYQSGRGPNEEGYRIDKINSAYYS